ncbi:hypothetical protein JX265_010477 [Neoarthrinium moseri]|uniref:60S ribosomal protein L35 n=1 Tax=Neoarthrinium moseri TaxID=1658444 RepID=A0A9Q0AKR9_9PEZI|nr:uncharacterized protein JN550_006263 [Neoarthrinium moseri]KAI1845590.1 hypothetical protein JX266_008201 [Neoarthrinium moseri]KAI1859474.1 hypothetical protein JX265_010477 [Neoarthrinium moseri]KAI1868688.1 hypothetical protein JN550_006263 [Neoarthrinium moseri]
MADQQAWWDNPACVYLIGVCIKYKIDPYIETSVPRFRSADNLECVRRLQLIRRTDNHSRSRTRPTNPPQQDGTQRLIIMSYQQSSSKVKAGPLWTKNKEDLQKQLGELKTELGQLRIQKINSSGAKLNRIHDLRKSIARVLTVINLKQRAQLRLFYKNKKYSPLDLRPKQTRAIRRRLSPADAAKTLEKTKKRSTHFPQRKYAVKA